MKFALNKLVDKITLLDYSFVLEHGWMPSNMGESKVVGPVQRRAISIFGSHFYYVVRPGPENAGYPPNQTAYKAGNHGQPCIGRW